MLIVNRTTGVGYKFPISMVKAYGLGVMVTGPAPMVDYLVENILEDDLDLFIPDDTVIPLTPPLVYSRVSVILFSVRRLEEMVQYGLIEVSRPTAETLPESAQVSDDEDDEDF